VIAGGPAPEASHSRREARDGGFATVRALRPFRLGAFEAAVAAGVPVVPVALRDRAADAIAAHCGEPRLAPADTTPAVSAAPVTASRSGTTTP
jgi:hypothetical protein